MISFLATYQPIPLFEAPRIHTNLLWDLSILFGSIGLVYFLVIFWMRNRISKRRTSIRDNKRLLAPMISNFLFYQPDSGREGHEEYIGMKIEIREMLKDPLNRKVITEVLMDLKSDVGGDARERVLKLYKDLGLHKDAYQKLESRRWEKISRGILELTEMQVEEAYGFIRKHVNNRRSIIRKQAQLATVTLKEEGISYFLDTNRYPISEWQQIKLLEILQQRADYIPPKFSAWLTSENRDVVLFSLRLVRHYRQSDAEPAINSLLNHRKRAIRMAAVECIREFQFQSSRSPLKTLFSRAGEALKLLILDTLAHIGTPEDLPFLKEQAQKDGNFLVRSKARSVINAIEPNSVLPTLDIDAIPAPEEHAEPVAKLAADLDVDDEQHEDAAPETTSNIVLPEELDGHNEQQEDAAPETASDLALPEEVDGEDEQHENHVPETATDIVLPEGLEPHFPEATEFEPAGAPETTAEEPKWSAAEDRPADAPETQALPWEQEEDEALFDLCFMQELEDILSDADPGDRKHQLPPEFLPIVQANVQPMDKPLYNQWLMGLEVDCEILSECPQETEELTEGSTGKLPENSTLSSDFLPLVVESTASGIVSRQAAAAASVSPPQDSDMLIGKEVSPDFELAETPVDREETAYFRQVPARDEPSLNCFSIFAEFFRQYDTESKLILLKEIPEVGGQKELIFLRSLQEDPDPQMQQSVKRAIGRLEQKLGTEETSEYAELPGPGPEDLSSDASEDRDLQLSFTPDFISQPSQKKKRAATKQSRKLIDRFLEWSHKMTRQRHG